MLAAQRARDIAAGVELTVDRDNDKNAVVALREIAQQSISLDDIRRHITKGVNRHSDLTMEDDELLAMAQEAFPGLEGLSEISEISEVEYEEEPAAKASEDDAGEDAGEGAEEPDADDIAQVMADEVMPEDGDALDVSSDEEDSEADTSQRASA